MTGDDVEQAQRPVPPLGEPAKVGLLDAISRGWRGSFSTNGRASRSEFWWYELFLVMFLSGVALIEASREGSGWITVVVAIVLVPSIVSLTVRRLHDGGYSGAWYLVQFVPFIGPFWLLILLVQPSQRLRNAWGPGPDSHVVEH